jgi:hypothetical protein
MQNKPSTRHEQVYHAASRGLAAPLSETSRRLHGLEKTYLVERQKTGACFASPGRSPGMEPLCCLKGGGLIADTLLPDGKQDAAPDIGERANGDRVAFALSSFALIVGIRPVFLLRALPGEGMPRVAQRLDARIAAPGFLVGATLKQDRRGSRQRLQARSCLVALSVVANFCQQARCKPSERRSLSPSRLTANK